MQHDEVSGLGKQHTLFGLFGAGGFGREVMPFARSAPEVMEAVFVDIDTRLSEMNGHRVLSESAFWEVPAETKSFNVAIANPMLRKKIAERAIANGAVPRRIQAPSATILDNNTIGEGAVFCANSIITSNSKVGKFFHLNMNSYVCHNCVIGDYVTFSPAVSCSGHVHIGDGAFLGTGAMIKQGVESKPLIIGEGAVIGMGAVVTKDVPPHTTVIGNPARPLTKG